MSRGTGEEFRAILRHLVSAEPGRALTGIAVEDQFHPEDDSSSAVFRNLNSAFLLALADKTHPLADKAFTFLDGLSRKSRWAGVVAFYTRGLSLVPEEISSRCKRSKTFLFKLTRFSGYLQSSDPVSPEKALRMAWQVFFPEGLDALADPKEAVRALRMKRSVSVTALNPRPIRNPAGEILFTSNVLMSPPPDVNSVEGLSLSREIKDQLRSAIQEPQLYWYDHPVQIGANEKENEVIYGMKGLDEAVAFEKAHGTVPEEAKVPCVLSLSLTHAGLEGPARAYLEESFAMMGGIKHLKIYLLSESQCRSLTNEIFMPAVGRYRLKSGREDLQRIIGVDGEYGRHYSLLKAIAAFWQVFVDSDLKGTFKIDLDQVFPQERLLEETGLTAFGHLQTPLWGAEGVDWKGQSLELGMIAGALVNQADIEHSLFTLDVRFPDLKIKGDEWIFCSPLTQALSTQAEMGTRYGTEDLDGEKSCLQRIHVTGGTTGILCRSLRKHRPFTPTFIGRAEDQAYLLSVLDSKGGKRLRYAHKDGLIMRHDKEAYAGKAIRAARPGKLVGDLVRGLLFSYYAKELGPPLEEIKELVDPFTGCFISPIPITQAYLRLALKGALMFGEGKDRECEKFLRLGIERLHPIVEKVSGNSHFLRDEYLCERRAWHDYYELMDRMEDGVRRRDPFTLKLRKRARKLVTSWQIAG